jgi:hypothetical protein
MGSSLTKNSLLDLPRYSLPAVLKEADCLAKAIRYNLAKGSVTLDGTVSDTNQTILEELGYGVENHLDTCTIYWPTSNTQCHYEVCV